MNLRSIDLTGRILSYLTIGGRTDYFRVIEQRENWFSLQNMFKNKHFTVCVNNLCVYNHYELVPAEYSITEKKSEYTEAELINMKLELQCEGYKDEQIDKMMSEYFTNT